MVNSIEVNSNILIFHMVNSIHCQIIVLKMYVYFMYYVLFIICIMYFLLKIFIYYHTLFFFFLLLSKHSIHFFFKYLSVTLVVWAINPVILLPAIYQVYEATNLARNCITVRQENLSTELIRRFSITWTHNHLKTWQVLWYDNCFLYYYFNLIKK